MKKKSLIIISGVIAAVSVAAITTGVVLSLRSKSTTKTDDNILNEVAEKVKVDYTNKNEIEISKFNEKNVAFSNFDNAKYEIVEKKMSISKSDNTKLVVSFKLKDKKTSDVSKEITLEISGFKKPKNETPPLEPPKPGEPTKPVNPDPGTPTDPGKEPTKIKEQLNLIAQKLQETDFVYSEEKTNLPVAYLNTNNFKINSLPKGVTFSILGVEVQKYDSTIAVVKYELTKDTIKSDTQTIEITGFESVEDEVKRLNEIAKKPNSLQFTGGDKNNFDIAQLELERKSLFTFKDLPDGYSFDITHVGAEADFTTAIISYQIYKTGQTIKSDIQTTNIAGFKKPDLRSKLNIVIEKVTLDYSGNKAQTEVDKIDKSMFVAKELTSEYTFEVTGVTQKSTDKTVAIVKFLIKYAKNHPEKSDVKTIEISGFKAPPRQKEELDKIIDNVFPMPIDNPRFIFLKNVTNLNDIKLKYLNLPNDIEVIDLKKSKKTDDDSKMVVMFKIRQKNETITSKEVTKEVDGFQKEFKTRDDLNKDISSIKRVIYKGDPTNVEIKNIDVKKLVFDHLPNSYEVSEMVIVPIKNGKSARIIFRIKEKAGTIISKIGTAQLVTSPPSKKFKSPSLETVNLNTLAEIAVPSYENASGTAFNSSEYVNLKKISFSGFDSEKYEIDLKRIVVLNDAGDSLEIFYTLKDKARNIVSDVQSKKITGFIPISTKKAEIEKILEKITVDYKGKSDQVLKTIDDVDKNKLEFSTYDKSKYELIIKEIRFDDKNYDDDPDFRVDKTKIYLDIVLKDKASGIETKLRERYIQDFKKA